MILIIGRMKLETYAAISRQHKIFSKIISRAGRAKTYYHLSECLLYWPGTSQTQTKFISATNCQIRAVYCAREDQ